VARRILLERAAELDIAEITAEIREQQPASALRFVKAVRESFRSLAAHPQMGRQYETTHLLLQNLRIWRVKGFEKYLIFYRAGQASIYIEHVLYGGRDIERMLGEEK
jgi:toxin ParE1/3/4